MYLDFYLKTCTHLFVERIQPDQFQDTIKCKYMSCMHAAQWLYMQVIFFDSLYTKKMERCINPSLSVVFVLSVCINF